jgi:hypothetical protein
MVLAQARTNEGEDIQLILYFAHSLVYFRNSFQLSGCEERIDRCSPTREAEYCEKVLGLEICMNMKVTF